MAARIRVYELARELGLTNKEALDLCESLGIGVKSHSSSIEDAQADRVRRRADREGLRREVAPPEPEAPKRPSRKAAAEAPATEPAPAAEEPAAAVAPSEPTTVELPAPPELPEPVSRPEAAPLEPAAGHPLREGLRRDGLQNVRAQIDEVANLADDASAADSGIMDP